MSVPNKKVEFIAERVRWTEGTLSTDLPEQAHVVVGFHIQGKCPSCQDDTSGICPTGSTVGLPETARGLSGSAVATVAIKSRGIAGVLLDRFMDFFRERVTVCVMRCRCAAVHPPPAKQAEGGKHALAPAEDGAAAKPTDQASSTFGCGSEWLVEIKYRLYKKQQISVKPVAAADEYKYWSAASAVADAAPASLSNVQTVAGKWQAVITAVLGLVGAVALVGGRDTLSKLGSNDRLAIGAFALASVLGSAIAWFLFAMASSGVPTIRRLGSPAALKNADLAPLRQARRSINFFRGALAAVIFSLLTAIIAVSYVWYAPDAEGPQQIAIVIKDDEGGSAKLCGTVKLAADGQVTIKPGPNGEKTHTYAATQVQAFDTC